MTVAARTRMFLARRRWSRAAVAVGLAALTGLLVHDRLADLDAARRSWSEVGAVLVADVDHAVGDRLQASMVELPARAVPPTALREPSGDARVRQRVASGEVVVDADVTIGEGPAASAAPGTAVVALGTDRAPGARPGLPVSVVADGLVLAERAEIVAVGDTAVHVAVPASDAPTVAAAAAADLASLLYLP